MKLGGSLLSLFTIISLIAQTYVVAVPTENELDVRNHVAQRTPSLGGILPDDALTRRAARRPAPKKVVPKKVVPKKVVPKKVAPKKVAPKKVAPKKVAPKKVAPKKAAPKKAAPKKAAPKTAAPKKVAPKKAPTPAKTKTVPKTKTPAPKTPTPAKTTAGKAANPKNPTTAKTANPATSSSAGKLCPRARGKAGATSDECKPVKTSNAKSKCAAQLGCGQCVLAGCGFNKVNMNCQPKSAANSLLITSPNKRVPNDCLPINQMQGLFPRQKGLAAKGKNAVNAGTIPASIKPGILTPTLLSHVFDGTGIGGNDAQSSKSGRHLLSTFVKANPKAKKTGENVLAKLQAFSEKTVWVDGPGGYDREDIINMCAVAVKASPAGAKEGNRVVMTKFGQKICVAWFTKGTGSCFPLGTKSPRQGLNADCTGNDQGLAAD